jgi:hypothetical protein
MNSVGAVRSGADASRQTLLQEQGLECRFLHTEGSELLIVSSTILLSSAIPVYD